MQKILSLALFCMVLSFSSFAQKYGHLNAGNVLSELSEMKAANSEMEAYSQQLITKGQQMAKEFQDAYTAFATEVQGGTISPVEQQKQEAALQTKQQAIAQYEQEVQQKIATKREELLAPILNKVNDAIKAVAEEFGKALASAIAIAPLPVPKSAQT